MPLHELIDDISPRYCQVQGQRAELRRAMRYYDADTRAWPSLL